MNETMRQMREWWRGVVSTRAERRSEKRANRLNKEVMQRVTAEEFEGEIWVCLDGKPVVPMEGVTYDLATMLTVSRAALKKWKLREEWYGKY